MTLGIGLGGLAQGLQKGAQIGSNIRGQSEQFKMNQQQQQQKQQEAVIRNAQESIKQLVEQAKVVTTGFLSQPGVKRDDPRLKQILDPIQQEVMSSVQRLSEMGIPGMNPVMFQREFETMPLQVQTADEITALKAKQAGEIEKAKQAAKPQGAPDMRLAVKDGISRDAVWNEDMGRYVFRGTNEVVPGDYNLIKAGVTATKTSELGLSKPVETKIQQKLVDLQELKGRVQSIGERTQPEFLQIFPRLGMKGSEVFQKLGGELKGEDKAKFEGFKTWLRSSIDNINLYIKEITGAQMSEKEAERLRTGVPDPGDFDSFWGAFKGDDYGTFQAKVKDILEQAELSEARSRLLLKQGLISQDQITQKQAGGIAEQAMSLEQVRSAIDARIVQLISEGRTDEEINQIIAQEF